MSKTQARAARSGVSENTVKKLMAASWPIGLFNLLAYITSVVGFQVRDLSCVEYFSGVAVIQRTFVDNSLPWPDL